ncbi:hypothetical protein [Allostreptomyces psammosilenae]|uniref:Uncharacterized protein n=1 Tax=Allostreptomyces psammosilenae TaxID=1892865 RepID=A0A853A832_9ACTN|nr:hypothetical protein [Allostreptomyces psammosilenae]NYI06811.1 hypothetical protein [Allostreptomyces psammosilenae]
METRPLVEIWRSILVDPEVCWVLFENGTCVVLTEPAEDLDAQARDILREFGPARAGGPAGDFGVIVPQGAEGWVVTGWHPDVLTYVAPSEVNGTDQLRIGLTGRAKRSRDGGELRVVHTEDHRPRR